MIPDRTILFVIDGLPAGIEQKITMPNLEALKKEGVWYKEVYLPLAAHPVRSATYPWTSSVPNPVLMSGTVFVGQDDVANHFIQHSFTKRPTAFFVNAWTYSAISNGFTHYTDYSGGKMEMVYKDELPVEGAKDAIKKFDPEFIRIHCQGPGSAGHRSHRESNQPYTNNIWTEGSPFIVQNQYVDRLLGGFVQWLQNNNLWENTVLMVMGDHGQCDGGGHSPYEPGGFTTQMVIAGKNIKKGITCNYAEIIDVAPTIAWLHGLPPPKYSNGRVLKEIAIGHRRPAVVRPLMKELDAALLEFQQLKGIAGNSHFQTIEQIGVWHQGATGNNYPAFVDRQLAALAQIRSR